MTGDELKEARVGCNMSREDLGNMLGVSAQVIGAWERLGQKHIAVSLPRESAATRKAKQRLPVIMNFMMATGVICMAARDQNDLVPAPQDWLPLISEGDPLALTPEPAVEGDMVLLKDATGDLSIVARVMVEREAGKLMCFVRPYQVMELPPPDRYRTIEYCMHKMHDGVPDRVEWSSVVPPDLV
ncbi:MAG: hypothetical protein K2M42_09320 [Oscillospiraceae bacterium]|nr:hypothetical protein [Oscillospiraceae bacterium]